MNGAALDGSMIPYFHEKEISIFDALLYSCYHYFFIYNAPLFYSAPPFLLGRGAGTTGRAIVAGSICLFSCLSFHKKDYISSR